jgi:YHS domain-containing protein
MKWLQIIPALTVLAALAQAADTPAPKSLKEALKPFNALVGSWKALGVPEGTREQKQKGVWNETIQWEWQFKGDDCWLTVDFGKGKYFVDGQLRYLPAKDQYQLTLTTIDKETQVFAGALKQHILALERQDEKKKETQRVVISLLHDNRYLYHYEVKATEKPSFSKQYQVGATKQGVPFAVGAGESGPECVVSGGAPTTKVTYKGQTYYVCCGGCRDAFKEEPEKYIKEYEARKAQEAKERAEKFKK